MWFDSEKWCLYYAIENPESQRLGFIELSEWKKATGSWSQPELVISAGDMPAVDGDSYRIGEIALTGCGDLSFPVVNRVNPKVPAALECGSDCSRQTP